ncbi:MAG: peptide deformylase [Burkholderiales bacterium]|jgi:peptide deformylase|nr:peptide deformylase [Burkholderiales bacterium]
MAVLPILQYPDPRLHRKAAPVTRFDAALERLARDLIDTMQAAHGVGLAATQVDVHQRVLVADASETHDQPVVYVNPVIVAGEGDSTLEEGCLSVPGIYDRVARHERVRVRAQDVHGAFFEVDADGLLSVCLQHEMDHLDGRVFVEYLSRLKQTRIAAKLRKQQKRTG